MATPAESAIGALHALGWNNAQIARAVGRDPSLIRQAAQGKKPVSNLAPFLQNLAASGRGPSLGLTMGPVEAPRRVTSGGNVARVRQGAQRIGAAPTPEQQALHVTSGGNKTLNKAIDQAARENKKVMLTGTFTNVKRKGKSGGKRGRPAAGHGRKEKQSEVPMFQKGGWDARALQERINNPRPGDNWKAGDAKAAIKGLSREMGNIEHVGRLQKVELHAFNPS